MAKGRPIFVKRVPWHEQDFEEAARLVREGDIEGMAEFMGRGNRERAEKAVARIRCCKQGCSRCMRKPMDPDDPSLHFCGGYGCKHPGCKHAR